MKQLVPESIEHYLLNEENKLKGGVGDKTSDGDVCPKQLSIGKLVEKEHSTDKRTAKEIALDHLSENETYYSDLIEKGMVDEPAAIKKYIEHFGEEKLSEKTKRFIDKTS